jgi:hypothetical protein
MELVPCPYAKKGVTCQSIACIESGFLHSEFSQESRMTTGSRQHPGKVFGAWVTLAAALVVVSCVVRLDRAAIFFGSWRLADLTGIRHVSGFTYVAPTHRPELSAHAAPSQAQVWEDGRPLPGPPNALHDDIRETGGGAYSFWYNYVYFSTPDHSDPTTNGRHYQIFYPWMVPTPFAYGGYAATLLALAVAGRLGLRHRNTPEVRDFMRRLRRVFGHVARPPYAVLAALLVAVFLITRLQFYLSYPTVAINPDSTTYVSLVDAVNHGQWPQFIIRTPGYPLLIWLVTHLVDRWMAVIFAQSLLALLSSLVLVYAVYRLRRSLALPATLAMIGFFGSSHVLIFETSLITESLYTSCLVFTSALFLLAIGRRGAAFFTLTSLGMAYTILVRPSGMFFLVIYVLVLGFMLLNRFPLRSIIGFALPFPAILLSFCAYNYRTLGVFIISPFGEAQIAGATLLYWEPDPSLPDFVNRALVHLPESYRKARISEADFKVLHSSWNTYALYPIFERSYNAVSYAEGWALGKRFGNEGYLKYRPLIRQAALVAIRRHPDMYAKFVWGNLPNFFEGIAYRFDLAPAIVERAKQHYGSTDRGYDLKYAKEYLANPPPPTIRVTGRDATAVITVRSTLWGRLQLAWQYRQQQIFHRMFWAWAYFAVLLASAFQWLRSRGRHEGAFVLLILTLMVLGACLVTCLVEESMVRYSYPTEFVYYLCVALLPLLWQPRLAPVYRPNLTDSGGPGSVTA